LLQDHPRLFSRKQNPLSQAAIELMADLHALLSKTLSKEQLAELYGKIFVQINLNTAAPSEILLIPGVGNRMLREFQEYLLSRREGFYLAALLSAGVSRISSSQ